jgi:hypothetical protein
MSAYRERKTKLTDKDCLIKALEEKGFHPEYHETARPLVGIGGDYRTADGKGHTTDVDKAMKAEIVLTRKEVGGASNEIGFKKQEDGTYQAIISAFDSHRYNDKWMKSLTDAYGTLKVKKIAKQQGLKYIGTRDDNGTTKLIYEQVNA